MWVTFAVFGSCLSFLGLSLRRDERTWIDPVGPFLFFLAIGLGRDLTGGTESGLGALLALPILWLALTGTRRDLWVASALTPLVFMVPLLIDLPGYEFLDTRRAVGWTAFTLLVAPVIQRMVQQLAQETERVREAGEELAHQEARWRVLLDHLPDTTVVVFDPQRTVKVVAGAGARVQGLRAREGMTLADVASPVNQTILDALLGDAFEGREATGEIMASTTGAEHEVVVTPLPDEDGERRALILARDVSAERERERALLRSKLRAERLFADAPHGLAVLRHDGIVVQANGAMIALTGVPEADLVGRSLSMLSPTGHEELRHHIALALASGGNTAETDWTLRNVQGNDVPVVLISRAVQWEDEAESVVLVNVLDVSERRRYEQRLAHLADHDLLTGLANRRRFERDLEAHLDHCKRYGPSGALLLLDLDHFKEVNDTLGHAAGDQMLVSIATLLEGGVRANDLVARIGGDEFAILLAQGDRAAAEAVARSIVTGIRDYTTTLEGTRRRVTASVGAVTLRAASGHADDVLALADMTMYDAKEAGRNQYAVLDEDSARPPRSAARLQWTSRIEQALEHDEFVLHLQPIQCLSTGQVRAAEALIRLQLGDELVPPSRFLTIAERSGLTPALDAWVVDHGVEILSRLRKLDPDFRLEVNLSGLSIGHPQTEQVIVDALRRHAVDPAALILEITETAAVTDVGLAREFAERMTSLGSQFALDDFGAGFGSFYYLKHLMFDFVKIDGEFVSHCHRSDVDRTILRSIVRIAHDLGKETVAEFVSEPAILDVVRAEGVDYAQGFLVGEPVPYDEFVARFLTLGGLEGVQAARPIAPTSLV